MNLDERTKSILIPILPALLVAVGYFMYFQGDLGAMNDSLEQQVASVRARVIPESAFAKANQDVSEAQEILAATQAEQDQVQRQLDSLIRVWTAKRTEISEDLSRLFDTHDLVPVDEIALAQGHKDVALPQSMVAVEASIAQRAPARAKVLWQFDFFGRYEDMQAALQEIANSDLKVVPVGLTMEEVQTGSATWKWRLIFWM